MGAFKEPEGKRFRLDTCRETIAMYKYHSYHLDRASFFEVRLLNSDVHNKKAVRMKRKNNGVFMILVMILTFMISGLLSGASLKVIQWLANDENLPSTISKGGRKDE